MFSQASVSHSVLKGGRAWWGDVAGGVHGRGACMAGEACVAGETATAADGTHLTGMHSCSLLFHY